jgi:hypothetical protein
MFSTVVLLATFTGVLAASAVLWAAFLRLGLHWASAGCDDAAARSQSPNRIWKELSLIRTGRSIAGVPTVEVDHVP